MNVPDTAGVFFFVTTTEETMTCIIYFPCIQDSQTVFLTWNDCPVESDIKLILIWFVHHKLDVGNNGFIHVRFQTREAHIFQLIEAMIIVSIK